MDRATEDIKIEYQYQATADAEERLAQAFDLILRLIFSDSPPNQPTQSDDPRQVPYCPRPIPTPPLGQAGQVHRGREDS